MFHVKLEALRELVDVDDRQEALLDRFGRWLVEEALPAGGIGPEEAGIVVDRHIIDSLAFSLAFPSPPASLVDVGSGVGLPGIPLGILWPDTRVRLLDRSSRRTDLAARAIRVLSLPNVTAETADLRHWSTKTPAFVGRAVVRVDEWPAIARRILAPGGVGVVGVAPDAVLPEAVAGLKLERLETGLVVLDRPISFLKMTACD